jgi:hypothetical protein
VLGLAAGLAWGGAPQRAGGAAAAPLRWTFPQTVNDELTDAPQAAPRVVGDSAGGLHAVWVDYRAGDPAGAITYAHLAPGAGGWERSLRVAGGEPGAAYGEPAVAIDTAGSVHVVWAERRDREMDIRHRRLPAQASAWSEPTRVNDDPAGALQLTPAVVADFWGGVHVAWVDNRLGSADVFYARRAADGRWSANSRINSHAEGDQLAPALAVGRTGWIYAVWQDSRQGRSHIMASTLPPGGDVWWPNAQLSTGAARAVRRDPTAAVDSDGGVHAFWVEEATGSAIHGATLRLNEPFWDGEQVGYEAPRGRVLTVAAAAGAGGPLLVGWSETRPDGGRIYSGLWTAGTRLSPERVDGSPGVSQGLAPAVVVDAGSRAHVVWQGQARRKERPDIFYSRADLTPPAYGSVRLEGWLKYRPGVSNCVTDGFVTVSCDGQVSPFLRLDDSALPYLGSYVVVSGLSVEEAGCSSVLATGLTLGTPPCPRESGGVTGLLTDGDQPVAGAMVHLNGTTAESGPSGRYFLDGIQAGRYAMTATLPCALSLELPAVPVSARNVTVVPTGAFVRGEVIPDGEINVLDLARVGTQFKRPPPYRPACSDVDGDGLVGAFDLAILSTSFGRRGPTPWLPPVAQRPGGRLNDRPAAVPPTAPAVLWLPYGRR